RKAELEQHKRQVEDKQARSYDHAWANAEASTSRAGAGAGDDDEDFWGENATIEPTDDGRMKEFEDFI
ncbi:hypothetical protein FS842_007417, partial [Serendipita sp. 407]